ncbi:MAG: hypothetical protein D6679_02790 [Candidatus Hydrogenedentota bacterium]|nr:MAG: hypothetical protein D6679_02790 [Candidatus Hydrogenedentota bacterium]
MASAFGANPVTADPRGKTGTETAVIEANQTALQSTRNLDSGVLARAGRTLGNVVAGGNVLAGGRGEEAAEAGTERAVEAGKGEEVDILG